MAKAYPYGAHPHVQTSFTAKMQPGMSPPVAESFTGEWVLVRTFGKGMDAYLHRLQVNPAVRDRLVRANAQFVRTHEPASRVRWWHDKAASTLTQQIRAGGLDGAWNEPIDFPVPSTTVTANAKTGTEQTIRTLWMGSALVKTTIDSSVAHGAPVTFRCYIDVDGFLREESIVGETIYMVKSYRRSRGGTTGRRTSPVQFPPPPPQSQHTVSPVAIDSTRSTPSVRPGSAIWSEAESAA